MKYSFVFKKIEWCKNCLIKLKYNFFSLTREPINFIKIIFIN
jgi:hypothetical protein